MPSSLEFIVSRARATLSVQELVQCKWVWEEKPIDGWKADIQGFNDLETAEQNAEAAMLECRGRYDEAQATLHDLTVQGVKMARIRYRKDAAKLAIVNRLSADGQSREQILDQAREWSAAWAQLDPGWSPILENTLTDFNELYSACLRLQQAYTDKEISWRAEAETLNAFARSLDDVNIAWYGAATIVFLEGTVEGNLVRKNVPTTYTPESQTAEQKPSTSSPEAVAAAGP